MLNIDEVNVLKSQGRTLRPAQEGDPDLGPLQLLPGVWQNVPTLEGHGWNMIALPFATEPHSSSNYRLLLNQFNETLTFSLVDKAVPNRGIQRNGIATQADQFLVALDYEQRIEQLAFASEPVIDSREDVAAVPGPIIHHEPGLWLHITNQVTDGLDIARLATIPHGDSVLALGRSSQIDDAPQIPDINGLPQGVNQDLNNPYLAPYKHFHENPFRDLFDPVTPNTLLKRANEHINIETTIILDVDTDRPTGGITNIPFIVKQANATAMKATFWLQKLNNGKLRLQYSQTVLLDFFPRQDGLPSLIRWPHVTINTLEKVESGG